MIQAMGSAAWDRYAWVEATNDDLAALTITLVRPAAEVHTLFEVIEELPGPMLVRGALDASLGIDDFAWRSEFAQLDSLDDWTVVIEPNGWGASMPDTVARLSSAGDAVSAFWNVNSDMLFSVARQGALLRSFDPLLYRAGDDPLPEEVDLPFGVGHPRAAALALLSRLTGTEFDREWLLGRRRPTFRVRIPE
jgi:hypothetical protein